MGSEEVFLLYVSSDTAPGIDRCLASLEVCC